MKRLVSIFASLLSSVVFADSGTWLYREGVGTSPANPAIWTDSANWVGGVLPDGAGATADFRAGDPSATVWVRIPDDQTVTLTYIEASTKNAQFRVIGGTIQVVKNTSGSDKDPRFRINDNNGINDSPKMTVYSDIVCQGANNLRLNVFSVGGALLLDETSTLTMSYVPLFYMDRYAESGEERRNVFNTVKRMTLGNTAVVQVPGVTEATTGVWRAQPGSRLLEFVSGTKGFSLQPGQNVSGEGIAPGSYVKYIYDDNFIELDVAPTVAAAVELSCAFARHAPKLSHEFDYVTVSSGQIQTGRTTEENEFTLRFRDVVSSSASATFMHDYKGSLYYAAGNTIDKFPGPGVLELVDISNFEGSLWSRASHFRFLPPTEGATETTLAKLGNGDNSYKSYVRGRIDVVKDLTLTIEDVTNWDGEIYKAGAGTAIFKTALSAMSLFRVEGGVAVLDPSDPSARISMLTVQNGATFRLAEGRKLNAVGLKVNAGATLEYDDASGLTWDEITVEPGAIIKIGEGKTLSFNAETFPAGTVFAGPGALTGFPKDRVNDYRFEGGIQFAAGGPLEDMILAPVGADLPTRVAPAFWVSVKDPDSIVQDTNGTVVRWNDCRGGSDAGYHFATNNGTMTLSQGVYPRYNGICIQVRHNNDAVRNPTSPADVGALVWDTPITGIKSVYMIMRNGYDDMNGGGALLGSTERLATCDFARSGWTGWQGDRFDKKLASPNVYNAPFYLNGRLPPAEVRVGSTIYRNVMMTFANAEQLVECHPLNEGASADCWGYQNAIKAGYGAWLGECLIFTNELTRVEQMQVTNYLMMKWFGSKMMFSPQVPASQDLKTLGSCTIDIAADEAARADSVKATAGGLTKTGDGTLYLEDVQTTSLTVEGGEVVLTSYDATDARNLPAGAVLHLDATDDDSFVGLTEEAGVEQVDTWYDTDSPETAPIHLYRHSAAQKKPTRIVESTAFVRPMKVVDYGPLKTSFDDGAKKAASGWWFSAEDCCAHAFTRDGSAVAGISNVTAVAGIWGSKYGGNQILGGWHQLGDGLRRVMTNNVCLAKNIAVPLIGKCYTANRWDGATDLAYDTFAMKNGEEVTAGEVGLSGTWDAVSFRVDYAAKVIGSSLGGLGARSQVGGLQVGELFVFTNDVTEAEIRRVDAYLNHKWFGRPVPSRYSPAEAGTLTVEKGAKVTVQGGAPVKVSSLAGGGTIEGSVAFTDGTPVIDVVVDADGLIDGPTLVSTQTFTGGIVRLSGAVSRLQSGRFDVLCAPGIVQGGNWTLDVPAGQDDSRVSLKVSEGHVRLSVAKGLILIFR